LNPSEDKQFRITTKDLDITVKAKDRREAIKNFFKLLRIFWEDWRDKIGQIAFVHENGKEYGFRIVPSLYNMGLIDEETAIANLLKVFGENPSPSSIYEARIILLKLSDDDKWMTT